MGVRKGNNWFFAFSMATALLLSLFTLNSYAQIEKPGNIPRFDNRPYHFGFILAYNNADFYMDLKNAFPTSDSLLSMQNLRQPGFNIGPIASLNLTKNIRLRFMPDISFQYREIEYSFLKADTTIEKRKRKLESTFINFPLNLKLRTDRVNNFAAYVIGGYQFSIDMATQKDVNNNVAGKEAILKMKKFDQALQIGGGFDFFLPYFKFGIELKLSKGINNVLIQDNSMYSSPINSLRTKLWVLSFTFEG